MKCLSLFSGIGGFDLALQRQGHEIVGASEIDKYARQIYSRHFPKVKIWCDATKIEPNELQDFDLLCAGFPCQAFSNAGKRLGFEESRGTLFFEIARIARQKRPGLLLLENVTGLLSHARGKTFAEILATLDEIGYDVEWQVLNSKHFLPQNRERVFIIGHLREKPTPKIFPIGEIEEVNVGTPKEAQVEGKRIRGTYTRTIDANYAKGGGSRTMIACIMTGHKNGRKVSEDYTFALTTRREQYLADPYGVRALTPLECERLQGFPDGWTEGIVNTQRYKCIGNAVTVPVVEFVIQKIREVTKE